MFCLALSAEDSNGEAQKARNVVLAPVSGSIPATCHLALRLRSCFCSQWQKRFITRWWSG